MELMATIRPGDARRIAASPPGDEERAGEVKARSSTATSRSPFARARLPRRRPPCERGRMGEPNRDTRSANAATTSPSSAGSLNRALAAGSRVSRTQRIVAGQAPTTVVPRRRVPPVIIQGPHPFTRCRSGRFETARNVRIARHSRAFECYTAPCAAAVVKLFACRDQMPPKWPIRFPHPAA